MASRNQGINKLTKDEYEYIMDNVAAKVVDKDHNVSSDIIATNQRLKMIERGKTIKLNKLLTFYRKIRSDNQLVDFMSMTFAFDPEERLYNFQNQIGTMYDIVIKGYIDRECPDAIFNTGLYDNKRANFIEYVTSTSKRGRDLRKLIMVYMDNIES